MGTRIKLKLKLRYATVQAPSNLMDLQDVTISAIQDGQILAYDAGSGKWFNITNVVGDMLKAIYDPTSVDGDAFNMDSMIESATKKIFTNTERTKLTALDESLYMRKLLTWDPAPTGAYSAVDADNNKIKEIDAGLTIPTGLAVGIQMGYYLNNGTKQTLTTSGLTVKGAPSANISPNGFIQVSVVATNTVLIVGQTEA